MTAVLFSALFSTSGKSILNQEVKLFDIHVATV